MTHIHAQFDVVRTSSTAPIKLQCKHCKTNPLVDNVTQNQGKHLRKCNNYMLFMAKVKDQQPVIGSHFKSVELPIDDLFAKVVYTSIANFSLFETPEWKAFFKTLKYTPPSRFRLSHDLLDSSYDRMKPQVQAIADAATHI